MNFRSAPPNVRIFSLSFSFFAAAGLMFLTAMILGVRYLPDVAAAHGFRSPVGWTIAHTMILGFMTMLAMGASFQLVQVILQTHLFSRLLGIAQFAVYTSGLLILLPSFFHGSVAGIGIGGSLVSVAVVLYVFNLTATMIRKRKWNVFVFGLALNLLALLFTVGFGIGMGVAGGSGWGVHLYERLFVSHLWFGLGGWMSGLIVTFSFKLLPMFFISLKKPDAEAWYIIALFQAGIWLQVGSVWLESGMMQFFSALCLIVSIVLFVRFVVAVRKSARQPGGTIPVVAHMNVAIAVIFAVWLVLDSGPIHWARAGGWTEALVVLLVAGWFTLSILGYMARIVPFLWWAYRFHTVWQKKSKVLLKDMVRERRMGIELWVYLSAVGIVAISVGWGWPPGAVIGQVAALLAAVVYLLELFRVFRY
jgi:hypothetical protein